MENLSHVIAQKLKIGFSCKYLEMYKIAISEEDRTEEMVLRYLETSKNIMKVVHEPTAIHVETAPPFDDTPAPTLKWVGPMADMRSYVQGFLPTCPYNAEKDMFVSTEHAEKLEKQCGAVVYSTRAHTKQMHFLYDCVSEFIKTLDGSVLVIGDNGGAICYRTQFLHTYTMYRGSPTAELLKQTQNRLTLVTEDEIPTLLQKRKFDHIVQFLYSYNFRFPEGQVVHYLSLIPGKGGIVRTGVEGEFNVNGKLVSLHPEPRGTMVCHTSLMKRVFDPMDHFVVWYTRRMPSQNYSSLAPLTDITRLGPRSNNWISDKLDGQTCYLEVRDHQLHLKDSRGEVMFGLPSPFSNQVLVVERVMLDAKIQFFVTEPLYCSGVSTFDEWVSLGDYFHLDWLRFKTWHRYPDTDKWQNFAGSGEGVVIKSGDSIIGSKDFAFRKLSTYFLKLPSRRSYEDLVSKHVKDGEFMLKGHHNIYTDPLKLYKGVGVYEINVATMTLWRNRPEKEHADPVWYVEAVATYPNLNKVFSYPMSVVRQDGLQNQGLIALHTVDTHRVDHAHVIDDSPGMLIVNFPADPNSVLLYKSKYYLTSVSHDGKTVGVLMT